MNQHSVLYLNINKFSHQISLPPHLSTRGVQPTTRVHVLTIQFAPVGKKKPSLKV